MFFEAFILTFNRAPFLRESLLSLVNQTVSFPITVLDNGSTDNTKEVVYQIQKQYPNKKILLKSVSENQGGSANFKRAQKLVTAKYCILFHDDDVLHPQYIKTALSLLKQHKDVELLSCANITTAKPNETPWKKMKGNYFLLDKEAYAAYLMCYKICAFPATIYLSKRLKEVIPEPNKYGKISDRPYIMDIVSPKGKALILEDRFIKYRTHPGQDSNTHISGPFENEILNVLKKYQKEVQNFPNIKKLYSFFIYEKIWMFYRWIMKSQMSFSEFEDKCFKQGILNKKRRFFSQKNLLFRLCKLYYKELRDFYFKKYRRKIS